MLSGTMDATSAAMEVGYESPSQFSREYRRLFGLPAKQDIKWLIVIILCFFRIKRFSFSYCVMKAKRK